MRIYQVVREHKKSGQLLSVRPSGEPDQQQRVGERASVAYSMDATDHDDFHKKAATALALIIKRGGGLTSMQLRAIHESAPDFRIGGDSQ